MNEESVFLIHHGTGKEIDDLNAQLKLGWSVGTITPLRDALALVVLYRTELAKVLAEKAGQNV